MGESKQAVRFRLKYRDMRDGVPKTMELYVISENPGYFYALEPDSAEVHRRYFVKCRDLEDAASLHRFRTEQEASWICSPYIAVQHSSGIMQTMEALEIERKEGQAWVPMSSRVTVYEYLPMDLKQFWQKNWTCGAEKLEIFRGQILLKLIEGVAQLHQAQLLHRDIKPQNIMVSFHGLQQEAAGPVPELDVKLTDMDGAHDGRVGPPAFYVKSQFFQPDWPLQSSVWLDIYSLCMVALWLYGSGQTEAAEYDFLRQISSRPLTKQELSTVIASAGIQLPTHFWDCLMPALETVLLHLGENGADACKRGMAVLYNLRKRLHNYYFGKEDWQPAELLRPRGRQPLWSTVLQIDRNYWPVLERGRSYHALSIIDRAQEDTCGAEEEEPFRIYGWTNGESLSVCYWKSDFFEKENCERLSSPPEIYLTCEDKGGLQGGFRQKVSIFGSILRGNTYENQLLAEKGNIPSGATVVLYDGKPLHILGADQAFCESIWIRAVRFHEDKEIVPLPVYPNRQRTGTAVNLVLVVDAPSGSWASSPSIRLLRQIAEEVQASGDCHPRFYGLAVDQDGGSPWSFCGGRAEVSPENLVRQYTWQTRQLSELNWDEDQPKSDHYAFDLSLPTLLIACLEHGPECVSTWLKKGRPIQEYSALQWAVDYLQVFLPLETEAELLSWEPLMPQFAAAVRPGGACIVTPLTQDQTPPDPERRWLTAIRHHCRRMLQEDISNGDD